MTTNLPMTDNEFNATSNLHLNQPKHIISVLLKHAQEKLWRIAYKRIGIGRDAMPGCAKDWL